MGRPPQRPRGPEDRLPKPNPKWGPFPESGRRDAIRWEFPVWVDGVPGCLVVRWFTGNGDDEGEASARGKAVTLLDTLQKRQGRQ